MPFVNDGSNFFDKKNELASQIMLKVVLCLELPFTFTISNENENCFSGSILFNTPFVNDGSNFFDKKRGELACQIMLKVVLWLLFSLNSQKNSNT